MEIEKLVTEAVNGSKTALESIAAAIQDNIYHLSLRMLADPDDAKDATQDILIKVITKLSSFRFDSKFNTWVYRIAANHLISEKKITNKDPGLTFDLYKMDLEQDLQHPTGLQDNPDYQVLLNELRISCTMGMLLCLNPAHRMAYILGDILELDHEEASSALAISKENFRKQLSRARIKVVQFTHQSCGLVSSQSKCHCDKKLTGAIERKRVTPNQCHLAAKSKSSYIEVKNILEQTQHELKTLTLQKSVTAYHCPDELGQIIESLVEQKFKLPSSIEIRHI
ncbi:RNA polymerase sigma factor [Vibrio sp. YMD68]|uniref:RNA polymerase sigma factor n=1 Tax=Vibrio sp. YMD68 TaxID=3042300 RepID=UPI00249A172A|nr:RNA polymerase sigma factor [Vibrio sp. YMD68]WGV98418.1 RNA polymerase sigma factor [Vibrio sp. YMD68]